VAAPIRRWRSMPALWSSASPSASHATTMPATTNGRFPDETTTGVSQGDTTPGVSTDDLVRCPWAAGGDPLYASYHDEEWGVPLHDERALFELLCLEGAQAGLAWITILRKREAYRAAFHDFDPQRCADLSDAELEQRLTDPGIVRNRLKVYAVRKNARAFLEVQAERGSFDAYLWDWVDGKPLINARKGMGDLPASTPLAEAISKDLKKRGFTFVGSTIVYAYLQSTGVVNDHTVDCFRYGAV
jgi:DNA-3-methyladenine glycosylase I